MRILLVAITLSLLPLSGLRLSQAEATSCQLMPVPDPRDRLDLRLEESSELVLIGMVIEEVPVTSELISSSTGAVVVRTLRDELNVDPETAEYLSTVRVEAVLKGTPPADELELPFLQEMFDCGTWPRLEEGQRLLLVLAQTPTWLYNGVPQELYWSTGPMGGNVVLADGLAYLDDYHSDLTEAFDSHLGSDEEIVRYVAMKVGSSDEATEAALATLELPVPDSDEGFAWALPAAVVTVAFWAGLAAIVFLKTRRVRRA